MKKIAHKTALHIGGWSCIGTGLLGLVLPIIPGFALIIVGLYILSFASRWLFNKLQGYKLRFPLFGLHYDKIDKVIGKYIKKAH